MSSLIKFQLCWDLIERNVLKKLKKVLSLLMFYTYRQCWIHKLQLFYSKKETYFHYRYSKAAKAFTKKFQLQISRKMSKSNSGYISFKSGLWPDYFHTSIMALSATNFLKYQCWNVFDEFCFSMITCRSFSNYVAVYKSSQRTLQLCSSYILNIYTGQVKRKSYLILFVF